MLSALRATRYAHAMRAVSSAAAAAAARAAPARGLAAPAWATLDVDRWDGKHVHTQQNLGERCAPTRYRETR
jgi:hypothetical protein